MNPGMNEDWKIEDKKKKVRKREGKIYTLEIECHYACVSACLSVCLYSTIPFEGKNNHQIGHQTKQSSRGKVAKREETLARNVVQVSDNSSRGAGGNV